MWAEVVARRCYEKWPPCRISQNSQDKFLLNTKKKNLNLYSFIKAYSQPAITCSKLTIKTVEQGLKYVQS